MSNIIFARTRYTYQSYTDYWSLVNLSGFPTCYFDEVDFSSENTYILSPMNGEWRPYVEKSLSHSDRMRHNHKAAIILWNLERPGGSGGISQYTHENIDLVDNGYVDRVVVSDTYLAEFGNLEYMPLGSHADLGTPGSKEAKVYDLIHLSCYSNNRSWLFDEPSIPKEILCGHTVAPNGWGAARHERLQRSKFMLSVHQDEFSFIEPLRFALASAYGLPILAEKYYHNHMYNDAVVEFERVNFCSVVRNSFMIYNRYYELGLDNRRCLTGAYNFRACVEMTV